MLNRRDLFKFAAFAAGGRRNGALRGVFATLTVSGALAREIEFVNGSGAHGVVFPWSELPLDQRMAAAEIVMARATGAVILCVQGDDLRSTRLYARHAESLRPAAVMAAPLRDTAKLIEHYRAIAGECGIPLMAHLTGGMGLEFALRASDEIPALRFVRDEAGHTLSRISEYKRAAPDLAVFTSGFGRAMPDEIERGASGVMTPVRFAGAYVRIWNDCLAGRRKRAIADLMRLQFASSA